MSEKIKIHALKCGMVLVDKALPFGGECTELENQQQIMDAIRGGRGFDHRLMLNVFCYLIEHPKGKILVDTGWHTDVRYNQYELLGKFHYQINQAFLPKGEAVDEQLAALGVKPSDLDYVLLTHLHSDHVLGVKLVKDAKKILCSDIELETALGEFRSRYEPEMWEGVGLQTFPLEQTGYGPHGLSYDLFGDGSVKLVCTAGHTMGSCAVEINNNGKFVIITGDCAYAPKSWEKMVRPGIMANMEMGMKSLAWIKEMSEKPECLKMLTIHDPEAVAAVYEL